MNAIEQLVDAHLAACCEPDAASRLQAIARIWNAEGRLVDPPLGSVGHEGISGQAAALLQQFPGHTFERTSAVDAHGPYARYEWRLRDSAGRAALAGTDFLMLDVDGRILQVVGFFGPLAARDRPGNPH